MRTINLAHPPKPCDYFDLIGGTSTGGLIAIMLGRLKMDIDECITVYLEISRDVFQPKKKRYNIFGRASDAIKVRGRFDSEALKSGIQKIVVRAGEDRNAKLRIEDEPKCRVLVTTSPPNFAFADFEKVCLCNSWRNGNAYQLIAWL